MTSLLHNILMPTQLVHSSQFHVRKRSTCQFKPTSIHSPFSYVQLIQCTALCKCTFSVAHIITIQTVTHHHHTNGQSRMEQSTLVTLCSQLTVILALAEILGFCITCGWKSLERKSRTELIILYSNCQIIQYISSARCIFTVFQPRFRMSNCKLLLITCPHKVITRSENCTLTVSVPVNS